MTDSRIPKILSSMAKLMPGGERVDGDAAMMLIDMLSSYDSSKVYDSLTRCFKELKFFPTFSEIIDRIDDGRPGVEEAWALAPKSDQDAAYLNHEILNAWSAANSILQSGGGMVASRMAFKEVYERGVKDHRVTGENPSWFLTRAFGPGSDRINEAALRLAVEKGRIEEKKAVELLPSYVSKNKISIEHNENAAAVHKLISTTFKSKEQ